MAQREVNYSMPVRCLMYDGIDFADQMQRKTRSNRGYNILKTSVELVSGLTEEDRLIPVLTVVLYYGDNKNWLKPVHLHDMLNFKTGLREVFELLGVCHDKGKMNKMLNEKSDYYCYLSRERGELISVFLDIPELMEKQELFDNEGGVNV